MSEMLEKAGRAACIASGREPENWLNPHDRELCIRIATAVVRALREPSFEMVEAPAQEAIDCDPGMADDVWQAMIDSILSTPTTRGEVK